MKNEELLTEEKLDGIFQYMQCIAIFVYKKEHYFIYDWKESFMLNMQLDLDIELEHGELTQAEYDLELSSTHFRNGIWQLKKDNFEKYLELEEAIQLSQLDLETLLFHDFERQETEYLYKVVENQLAHDAGISSNGGKQSDFGKINQIASRLPLFYINFDTEVYMHMNWDRCHEGYAYEGWFSKAHDFGYLIPDELCYWKIDGKDFWKFRQIN